MYIPTQEERYSKVARFTLLLCVMMPSAVVAYLAEAGDLLTCCAAFLLPPSLLLDYLGFNMTAAMCLSALVQAIIFFWLSITKKLTAKAKITIAITWGMLFALLLRLFISFAIWQQLQQ